MKTKELTGRQFSRLTVIGRSHIDKHKKIAWLCKCECGRPKVATSGDLNSGRAQSCGCLKLERLRATLLVDITGKRFGKLGSVSF